RAATAYGTHVAGELGHGLADRGWTVVSGGAYGIDGAAHRGALGAGGVTIAALPSGIDTSYPVGHTALFERIAEAGLLLTEYPPGESPQKHRFLLRNRLIAALGAGVVVVEVGARSGANTTAERAHQLGHPVMAVPGPVTSALSVGTHTLIRDGGALLVCSAAQVVEAVGRMGEGIEDHESAGSGDRPASGRPPALDPALERVLEAVPAGGAATVEEIALAARTTPVAARRALPTLVLRGLVDERAGTYRLSAAMRERAAGRSSAQG
ncbi:MAG TPA: DNA-processing protein DprA, partial [Cryptosporangiaceae bacterium]|nr:DNA-processing protein DprA [Cryptosporangiaceae bacterium]